MTFLSALEAQVRLRPHQPAVIGEDGTLSYEELNSKAEAIARRLQAMGVGPEVPVALCVERSLAMVIAIVGILKAGGAYVPVDPNYPDARIEWMLADSGARVLLTQQRLMGMVPATHNAQVLLLDGEPSRAEREGLRAPGYVAAPDDLAYIMYTSGSTGMPKGVMITHGALMHYVDAALHAYDVTASDHVLQFSSISFDGSVEEIFCALSLGATLFLRTEAMLGSMRVLLRQCDEWRITFLSLTTAYWHELTAAIAAEGLRLPLSLRLIVVGGEKINSKRVRTWFEHLTRPVRLLNSYGPTETTVVATVHEVTPEDSAHSASEIPIGKPLRNTRVYILDEVGKPLPAEAIGEIYIGGAGVARGYLNRPELTQERFVADPAHPLERAYRTGDLGRYRKDGVLEFLGRIDEQVKIRGFRIEPGEIEAVLQSHPKVHQAAVIPREDRPGELRLVAYLVAQGTTPAELRTYIGEHLPEYMIPAAFVCLETFPLTGNGKIDRAALPAPDLESLSNAPYTAPRSSVEEWMVGAWSELLGLERIGIEDDFFLLGGHSLLAVRLMERIRQRYQQDLPLAILFEARTVARLARIVQERYQSTPWSPLVTIQPEGLKPPLFCVHPGGGNVLGYADLSRHLGEDYPVYGLQAHGVIEGQEPHTCIHTMASLYIEAMRQVQPTGPYYLFGSSFGGLVAYEMAVQLHRSGERVAMVLIGDEWVVQGPHFKKWRYWLTGLTYPFTFSLQEILELAERRWKGRYHALLRAGAAPFANELHRRMFEAHSQAADHYQPRLYAGKVILLRNRYLDRETRRMEHYFGGADMGWGKLAEGGVEVHWLPGWHDNMFYGENAPSFAACVKDCMQQAMSSMSMIKPEG